MGSPEVGKWESLWALSIYHIPTLNPKPGFQLIGFGTSGFGLQILRVACFGSSKPWLRVRVEGVNLMSLEYSTNYLDESQGPSYLFWPRFPNILKREMDPILSIRDPVQSCGVVGMICRIWVCFGDPFATCG